MLHRVLITLSTGLLCLIMLSSTASAQCPNGQATCSGVCVDLRSNGNNCGACGVKCKRSYTCEAGTCKLECPDVQLACGDVCATPASNPEHCGGCGKPCGTNQYCSQGICQNVGAASSSSSNNSCPANQKMCSGQCRDVQVDSSHCGACGKKCKLGSICKDGQCANNCPVIKTTKPTKSTVQQNVKPAVNPKTNVQRR